MKRIICVIPARGGSKGIPHKNLQVLGGKTLLAYAIEVAQKSGLFETIVVSTDDRRIQKEALRCKALCPFLRPAYLSGDNISTYPVVKHAVDFIEKKVGYSFDFVMVLQPTSPFRNVNDLKAAMRLLKEKNALSLASICRIEEPHPQKAQRIMNGKIYNFIEKTKGVKIIRRQDTQPAYFLNGAIYLSKREVLKESLLADDVIAYEMPPERSVNIDTMLDLEFARYLINRKRIRK